MILKKQRRIIDSVFGLQILFIALILFSCEMKKIETDISKDKIIGSIDSLSINKKMHALHYYNAPSFIFHVSIYNIDTADYKIFIPSFYEWRRHNAPIPYLWLLTEHMDTCHEAVIFDYLGIDDTIITIKNQLSLTINPYRYSRTIPSFYNMHEIISDYENIIFGDFYFKMLNLYNGDTIIFNKSNHFKVKYVCDGIEFSPLDSVRMNERLLPPGGGIIYPPGDIFSKKAQERSAATAASSN